MNNTVETLNGKIKGDVFSEGSEGFDQARSVWNAMIDRRPALIVQCKHAGDVQQAVNYANQQNLPISIWWEINYEGKFEKLVLEGSFS